MPQITLPPDVGWAAAAVVGASVPPPVLAPVLPLGASLPATVGAEVPCAVPDDDPPPPPPHAAATRPKALSVASARTVRTLGRWTMALPPVVVEGRPTPVAPRRRHRRTTISVRQRAPPHAGPARYVASP